MSGANVVRVGRDGLQQWGDYAAGHCESRAMHLPAWYDVLSDVAAVEPLFLAAKRASGAVCGILPLYVSHSPIAGKHLTSLEDGMLADDPSVAADLLEYALAERDRRRGRYLLLRGVDEPGALPIPPATTRTTVRRTVDTSRSSHAIFALLDRRVRREIRRAGESGFQIVRDINLGKLDGEFYDEYAAHVHQLGTPVMSRALMTSIRRHLGPENLRLYLVESATRTIVGGILGVVYPRGFAGWYGVVRRDLLNEYANYLLYWKIIEDLANDGIAQFDLGRSAPESGPHQFKKKWPGVDRSVYHAFFPRGGVTVDAEASLYAGESLRQRVWKRLPPALALQLGPIVRRGLPFG